MNNLNIFFVGILVFCCGCFESNTSLLKEMAFIQAGEFIMGSNKIDKDGSTERYYRKRPFYLDEHPERKVFLDSYYMDMFEVTNSQYSKFDSNHIYEKEKKDHPVVLVSWYEAEKYCGLLGKRLPTEAEWEKAARGTDGREYPWGNEFDVSRANIGMDKHDTTPVGSYKNGKSPYGIYDMAGNVWEWTMDWYEAYPGSDYKSEDFGKKIKVIRGGARIRIGHYNLPLFFRSAHRFAVPPENKASDTGFRCAKDILPQKF